MEPDTTTSLSEYTLDGVKSEPKMEPETENNKRDAEAMDVEPDSTRSAADVKAEAPELKKMKMETTDEEDVEMQEEENPDSQQANDVKEAEEKMQQKEVMSNEKTKTTETGTAGTAKKPKKKVQEKILAFMGRELQVGRREVSKEEVAQGCGYQKAGTYGFFYSWQDLQKNQELISKSSTKGCYELTKKGKQSIPKDVVLEGSVKRDNAGQQQMLLEKILKGCEEAKPDKLAIIFDILKDGKPHNLEELCQKTGYKNLKSKGLGYTLRDMEKKWKIVEKPMRNTWQFTDLCFPDGRPE